MRRRNKEKKAMRKKRKRVEVMKMRKKPRVTHLMRLMKKLEWTMPLNIPSWFCGLAYLIESGSEQCVETRA